MYTCMCTYIHTHAAFLCRNDVHTHIHTYIHTYIDILRTRMVASTCLALLCEIDIHTYIPHTNIHTHIHTYIHTYAHTYIHTTDLIAR